MMTMIAGGLIGAAAGFVVGKYMSKLGMGCPLICDPRISTVYFAVLGVLFAG